MNEMDLRNERAEKYTNLIRNGEKKAYALRYKAFLQGDEPEPTASLYMFSFMWAQAVRENLNAIFA